MSERGHRLLETANGQISELIDLLAAGGAAAMRLPCRQKLGDGTVGATALHTTESYRRIAAFLGDAVDGPTGVEHGRGAEDVDLDAVLAQLATAADNLAVLADLSDEQLDAVPPAGTMRFCDGRRTLEQVVASALRHQRHQIDALKAAVV